MLRLPPFDKIGAVPVADHVNADPANSVQGSILNVLIFNQLQHEGENLELLAGLSPDSTNLTQWTQAVSRGGIWAGPLTGTGDLAVATLGTVLPALLQGMRLGVVATASNTVTNPKLRVANLGSTGLYTDFPILKEDGSSLAAGEIKVGRRYRFEADGAGNVFISGGGLSSGLSDALTTKVVVGGRMLFAQTAAGTYTFTPDVPLIYVRGVAGGGGGGGGNGYAGAGGLGGNYFEGAFDVIAGQPYTIVVGAGGIAGGGGGGGAPGGNGGSTYIARQGGATLASALGGTGGGSGGNSATNYVGITGASPGKSNIAFPHGGFEILGYGASNGIYLSSPVLAITGIGGGSYLASSTPLGVQNGAFNGSGSGGGGGGGAGPAMGGIGAPGAMFIVG